MKYSKEYDFELLNKDENKFITSKKLLDQSGISTDISEQANFLNKEVKKENKKVLNFIEELKNWKFNNANGEFISIKKSVYEKMV